MFDIAFSEILVIAVVALIVIGPEKLPKTARTLGHLFGRLQRYVSEVKADISREMELEELKKLQQQVHSAAREIETSMHSAVSEVDSGVRSVEAELNKAASLGDTHASAGELAPLSEPPAELVQPAVPATEATAASSPPPPAEPPRQPSLPGIDRP